MSEVLGSWAEFAVGNSDEPLPTLVHGGARGADHMAGSIWRMNGGPVEVHHAEWSKGKGAGYARNAEMVNLGADVCIAFFANRAENRGTRHCSTLAASAGIKVIEVWG